MEETKKALAEILRQNDETDAFSIKGRGLNNCAAPPDVNAFVQAFKKKMTDSAKKDKRKGEIN